LKNLSSFLTRIVIMITALLFVTTIFTTMIIPKSAYAMGFKQSIINEIQKHSGIAIKKTRNLNPKRPIVSGMLLPKKTFLPALS